MPKATGYPENPGYSPFARAAPAGVRVVSTMTKPVSVQFFSDILCVWAYIGQTRLDQLVRDCGDQLSLSLHFMSVFGDVEGKMQKSWEHRGGVQAYNAHVQQACEAFPEIAVHPECWTRSTPRSSMSTHIYLCAIKCLAEQERCPSDALWQATHIVRERFFVAAEDISTKPVLEQVVEELGLGSETVNEVIRKGEAHAVLSRDFDLVRDNDVRVSPTFAFNDWRQRLQGNVGYRLIHANVRELLERPTDQQASWC